MTPLKLPTPFELAVWYIETDTHADGTTAYTIIKPLHNTSQAAKIYVNFFDAHLFTIRSFNHNVIWKLRPAMIITSDRQK